MGLLLIFISSDVKSQNPNINEFVLFEDDFEDGTNSNWELAPQWKMQNEPRNSYLTGRGHSWANLKIGNNWTNYRVNLKFRILNEGFHLMVRLNNQGRYYVGVDQDGLTLNKQFFPNQFLPTLEQKGFTIRRNTWHTITVTVIDNRIRIAIDGLNHIDYIDNNNPFTQGKFALETIWDDESHIHFDDISIIGFEPVSFPTPTSTSTPTPSPYPPTPTLPPRPTHTPIPEPEPTTQPGQEVLGEILWTYDFTSTNLFSDEIYVVPPPGYELGEIISGESIPNDTHRGLSDGTGATINVSANKGGLLLFPVQPVGSGGAVIRFGVKTSGQGAQIALGGLDANQSEGRGNMDGSIATRVLINSEHLQDQWQLLSLYIDPVVDGVVPVIQVVSTSENNSTSVYLDNLEIIGFSSDEAIPMIDFGREDRYGSVPFNTNWGETVWNYGFSNNNLASDNILVHSPGNPGDFEFATYQLGESIPGDEMYNLSDGIGATFHVNRGKGITLFGPNQPIGPGGALVSVSVWANRPGAQVAIGGLDSMEAIGLQGIDGSIATRVPANTEQLQHGWHRLTLYIDPQKARKDRIIPVLQVLSLVETQTDVYVDNLRVTALSAEEAARLRLQLPTLTQTPPMTLHIGDFTFEVESYDHYVWKDWKPLIQAYTGMVNVSGTAWTTFNCKDYFGNLSHTLLEPVKLNVVEFVDNPAIQISLQEARFFNPNVSLGQTLRINLPTNFYLNKPLLAETLVEFMDIKLHMLKFLMTDKGKIKVRFDNLTVECNSGPFHQTYYGNVIEGSALYPTSPAVPLNSVELYVAGFTLYLDRIEFKPNEAIASAELELPPSITRMKSCEPPRIKLGDISINPECQFYQSLPALEYGPWDVSTTGMRIEGKGAVADFSPIFPWNQSTGTWRGLQILNAHTFSDSSEDILSNSGYLKAGYDIKNGLLSTAGLSGDFTLNHPFLFKSVQPYGYDIRLNHGSLTMKDNQIIAGNFTDGWIELPKTAVVEKIGNQTYERIRATFGSPVGLTLDQDLNLFGHVEITQNMYWGKFTQRPARFQALEFYALRNVTDNANSCFYLAGRFDDDLEPYWPLDGKGKEAAFKNPSFSGGLCQDMIGQGIQGVTLKFKENFPSPPPVQFDIFTPDTPNQQKLSFSNLRNDFSWLNIVSQGVHGILIVPSQNPIKDELGPTHKASYVADTFFDTEFISSIPEEKLLQFQFVDSAVYHSEVNGQVWLNGPIGGPNHKEPISFRNMNFTSTAHIAAASVVIENPMQWDYWGVELVQKPASARAGVLNVKTGQIFLTAAGIQEKRHFMQPFWLTWGEILASGHLGQLYFDYNSSYQAFDHFPFVHEYVALSEYDEADAIDKENAYLHACGTLHFDFFGAYDFNILDYNDIQKPNAPHNGRRIELCLDSDDPRCTVQKPTETHLYRNWSNGFGHFHFDIHYNDNTQNGFLGNGTMEFYRIHDPIDAWIELSSTGYSNQKICMGAVDNQSHDFDLGPFDSFGSIDGIKTVNDACIEEGLLKQVDLFGHLNKKSDYFLSSLETTTNADLFYTLTPAVSDMTLEGSLKLSLLNLSIIDRTAVKLDGKINYIINRELDFVEGLIEGNIEAKIEPTVDVDISSPAFVEADGLLNWHIGSWSEGSYQAIQAELNTIKILKILEAGGGFYLGYNAPKDKAHILIDAENKGKYGIETSLLPDKLSGFYGHLKYSEPLELEVISGGFEVSAGLGIFDDSPNPHFITKCGFDVWGSLFYVVSIDAGANTEYRFGPCTGFVGKLYVKPCINLLFGEICYELNLGLSITNCGLDWSW